MSTRETLAERTKKATAASRDQVHAYIGMNDYWYERSRRRPVVFRDLSATLSKVTEDGADPIRRGIASVRESYAPSRIRRTVADTVGLARDRRKEFADRGESIIKDWKQATAVKDADALITSVRAAGGRSDIAKSVRVWAVEYPPAPKPSAPRRAAAKEPATKTPPEPGSIQPAAKRAPRKRPSTSAT